LEPAERHPAVVEVVEYPKAQPCLPS